MLSKKTLGLMASTLAVALVSTATVTAAPLFKITELFVGIPGSDPTTDWMEITNFGDTTGNIGSYYYDDDSADPSVDYILPNFDVEPCESVIVLIEALDDPDTLDVDEEAANIAEFYSFWGIPSSVQVGATDGGSLGGGGDAAFIFDSNFLLANTIDSMAYTSEFAEQQGTIQDMTGDGPISNSTFGHHGAFYSAGSTSIGNLIGSPGVACVPEPASMAMLLLGMIGLVGIRRRK